MNDRVELFGIHMDRLDLESAVGRIYEWFDNESDKCRFIVTPNVDHVVMYQQQEALRSAYDRASMVLADGRPVVAASKLLKRRLPACVPGSDLVPALLAATSNRRPIRFFLLGAGPGVAERACRQIEERWPDATPVGYDCPPLGFQNDAVENERIVKLINEAEPDLLVIGLGAPKQELWISEHQHLLKAKVAVCAGATIDFLAGEKKRAPKWLRFFALEWLHRMLSEPKRLVPRYARDAWYFPQIFMRQWFAG